MYFASDYKPDLYLKSSELIYNNISLNVFTTFTYIISSNLGAKPTVVTPEMSKGRIIRRLGYCPLCCHSPFQKFKSDQDPHSYIPKSKSILPLTHSVQSSKGSELPAGHPCRGHMALGDQVPATPPTFPPAATPPALTHHALSSMLFLTPYSTWIPFPTFFLPGRYLL